MNPMVGLLLHTAGAIAIGALARQLFSGTPKSVRYDYYESFSET